MSVSKPLFRLIGTDPNVQEDLLPNGVWLQEKKFAVIRKYVFLIVSLYLQLNTFIDMVYPWLMKE